MDNTTDNTTQHASPLAGWDIDLPAREDFHAPHNWDQYIEIDWATRTINVRECPLSENAVPAYVWHGHANRLPLPNGCDPEVVAYVLDEHAEHLNALAGAHYTEWDGSNIVARFDRDAPGVEAALEALRDWDASACAGGRPVETWDAWDWLDAVTGAAYGLAADSSEAEIERITSVICDEALGYSVSLDPDAVERWLRDQLDRMIAEAD